MSQALQSLADRLRHRDVLALVRSRGGRIDSPQDPSVGIVRAMIGDSTAFIPKDPDLAGYQDGLLSVVRWVDSISAPHPNGILGLLQDLIIGRGDVFRFRLEEDDVVSGTIPFGRADRLVSLSRTAIQEAERSYLSKVRASRIRAPFQFGEWSESCRLGQTEEGSYIVKVHCPLDKGFTDEELSDSFLPDMMPEADENGSGRKVSMHLLDSLGLIQGMAESRNPGWVKSEEFKQRHVPSRLIKALSMFSPSGEGELSISCNWSSTARIPDRAASQIRFNRTHLPVLQDAAKIIAPEVEFGRREYPAMVAAVKADPDADSRTHGSATLVLVVDSKPQKVTLKLDPLMYDRAVEAHRLGRGLRIFAELKKDKQKRVRVIGHFDILFSS